MGYFENHAVPKISHKNEALTDKVKNFGIALIQKSFIFEKKMIQLLEQTIIDKDIYWSAWASGVTQLKL